ncbi:transglutaminase domain-containing protein [Lentibacillus sp. N15]|uniref:transglutaminase family protein n=1 Tax=Lentibacillus songyuanensis TaxID=3136161 RepID=UPI0031BA9989
MNTNADKQIIPFFYTSILYLLGFLLLLEWLYPVQQITDTNDLPVFIVYAAFCFMISLLQMKWWLSFLLKGLAMLFIIHMLFMPYGFLSMAWVQQFSLEMTANVQSLVHQNWYELTPLFRSFLFLLLIWLMSYLLYYWFIVMKRIFLFVLLTIVYVTVLDTFTIYEADGSIVRTFIISFLAFGLANMFKLMDSESIRFTWLKKSAVWALPLIAVVLFATFIGYAAPKFDPRWPDPVPFFQSAANKTGYSGDHLGTHKVGYGEDDSQLGGSFVQDYTPVFQAAMNQEHYWRIETKDLYTGKGWEQSQPAEYVTQSPKSLQLKTFADDVETERQQNIVTFQGNTNIVKLLYPYGIRQVNAQSDADFLLDEHSGSIRTQVNKKDVSLSNYTITFDYPSFAIDQLRNQSTGDPAEVKERYTQLPESLPERVGELAKEITAGKDTRYDKARAIETYFGQNGFTYQTSDVPVPKENQDYVDQFLYDSKKGYCDNYSTTMVVMLRTLEIPARWAKGFTSGEQVSDYIDDDNNTYDLYEVTSANAHSWVEVYFPGSGWVPFEPTQGFSNLGDFHENVDQNDDVDEQEETEEPPEQESDQIEPEKETDNQATDETDNHAAASESHIKWWSIGIGSISVIIIAVVLYVLRFWLKTKVVSRKLTRSPDPKTFQDAYHHLLKLLKHKGLPLETGQTLREYAEWIDKRYETDDMRTLTDYYEQLLYHEQTDPNDMHHLHQLWKNLINRIMA